MRRFALVPVLLAPLLAGGAATAPKAPAPARRLPAPQHVSPQARQQVKARMGLHATTMQNLVRAVVLLDRPTIRALANRIADEEIVARTSGTGDQQPPPLPPEFFAQQDSLAATARQLAAAAVEGGDDSALADGFSALMRTCVGCHSTYLHGQPDAQPADQPPAARPQ